MDKQLQEMKEIPEVGLMRIKQVLRFVPVSRSNWWAGVKAGRFPKPVKLSERVTCWKSCDIRRLVEGQRINFDDAPAKVAFAWKEGGARP